MGRILALFVAQKEATKDFSLWLLDGEWLGGSKNGNRGRVKRLLWASREKEAHSLSQEGTGTPSRSAHHPPHM